MYMDVYFGLDVNVEIDELEDGLGEVLGDEGEVTGSGVGIKGGNIDIEFNNQSQIDDIVKVLKEFNLPVDTYYIIDKVKTNLYGNNSTAQ